MAANINIHDLTDVVTVDATQFDVTAAVITHMNIFGGEDDVRITGKFITNSADGSTGGNTVNLLEPGTFNGQDYLISDIIRSSWSVSGRTATITIDFGSDPPVCDVDPSGCLRAPLNTGIFEDGTLRASTGYSAFPQTSPSMCSPTSTRCPSQPQFCFSARGSSQVRDAGAGLVRTDSSPRVIAAQWARAERPESPQ